MGADTVKLTQPDHFYCRLVHVVYVLVDKTGYGYFDASQDNIYLYEGDIVAHDTFGNSILAHLPHGHSPYSDLYCPSLQGTTQSIDGNACTVSNEFHQVKAVYSVGLGAKVPFEFTAPGNISMNVSSFVCYPVCICLLHNSEFDNLTWKLWEKEKMQEI